MKQKNGFTLIELLVVATIIIILSAIGLVSYSNAGKSARNSKRKSDIETVRQALVLYKSDTGGYPTDPSYDEMILELVNTGGYISDPTPVDPKNLSQACGEDGLTTCEYNYSGNAQIFTLTAPLEGEALPYTASNP
jgi:prepilin-type N-terminal cleavage/methylation domain-containing protein